MREAIQAMQATRSLRTRPRWMLVAELGAMAWIACTIGCSTRPAADRRPGYAQTLDQAEAALAVGELDAALAGFAEATSLRPADVRGWEGLALSHLARGEDAAALDAFSELDARSPEALGADVSRARCGAALRRVEAQLEELDLPAAQSQLASAGFAACSEAGRLGPAVRVHLAAAAQAATPGESELHYQRVLELDPGNQRASLELAVRLLSNGRASEALRLLSVALETHPRSPALVEATVGALTGGRRRGRPPNAPL